MVLLHKYGKRLHREVDRRFAKRQQKQKQVTTDETATVAHHPRIDGMILIFRSSMIGAVSCQNSRSMSSPSWQDWAINAAHGAGCAVDHVMVPLLAVSSSLIGAARCVQASRSWPEPLSCRTGIIGASGSGKTPGLDVSKRALAKIEHDRQAKVAELRRRHETNAERAKAKHKAWKEAVEKATKKGLPTPPMPSDADVSDEFVAPRLYVSDATVQKLAALLGGAAMRHPAYKRRARWPIS